MKKIIKQIGGSLGFTYSKQESEIYKLSVGDIIEISEPIKIEVNENE